MAEQRKRGKQEEQRKQAPPGEQRNHKNLRKPRKQAPPGVLRNLKKANQSSHENQGEWSKIKT